MGYETIFSFSYPYLQICDTRIFIFLLSHICKYVKSKATQNGSNNRKCVIYGKNKTGKFNNKNKKMVSQKRPKMVPLRFYNIFYNLYGF